MIIERLDSIRWMEGRSRDITHPGYSKDPDYGRFIPSSGDWEWTDIFGLPGHIYGGKGGFNTMFPTK